MIFISYFLSLHSFDSRIERLSTLLCALISLAPLKRIVNTTNSRNIFIFSKSVNGASYQYEHTHTMAQDESFSFSPFLAFHFIFSSLDKNDVATDTEWLDVSVSLILLLFCVRLQFLEDVHEEISFIFQHSVPQHLYSFDLSFSTQRLADSKPFVSIHFVCRSQFTEARPRS